MVSMHIDEDRKHVLKKIQKLKKGVKLTTSDHNTILTELNLKVNTRPNDNKMEMFNLKNKEFQARFKEYTSNTKILSSIFDNDSDDLDSLTNRLVKKINGCIATNFKKIRVTSKKKSDDDNKALYDKIRFLNGKHDDKSMEELNNVMKIVAEKADENFQKLKEELLKMKPSDGKLEAKQLWK